MRKIKKTYWSDGPITKVFKSYPPDYNKRFFKYIWIDKIGNQKMVEEISRNDPDQTYLWHGKNHVEKITFAPDGSIQEVTDYYFTVYIYREHKNQQEEIEARLIDEQRELEKKEEIKKKKLGDPCYLREYTIPILTIKPEYK